MDFQSFVDSIPKMACVVSVEKKPGDTYGDIRIVTGNQAYISSIENPAPGTQMLRDKFTPNCLYTDYLTRDLNFEDYSYRCAVLKKCLHSYAQPDRMSVWLNMMFIPLWPDDGDLCYCVYMMEINFEPDVSNMSVMSSNAASAALETCIKLSGTKDFKVTILDVIKDIRKLCDAEHCCILTLNPAERSCTVLGEAFAPNTALLPMATYLDSAFYEIADSWEDTIAGSNCILVKNEKDMELIKERNPIWYESLTGAGAHNIVLFPLKSRGERLGYMWALNYDESRAVMIKETLEVTTFILGAEIGNYLLMDRLRNLGSRDMLTGVMNRNEMNNYVDSLSNGKYPNTSVGVIFADINGLKEINDVEGHNAGDNLIRNAADILREIFDENEIYRAGGDEFAIIMTGITEDNLKQKLDEIEEKCAQLESVSIAHGGSVEKDSRNIRMALRLADERMYENKTKFYSQSSVPERGRGKGKDRSAKESELIRRMNYDQLTGLPSMTFFFKLAENAREKMHEEGVESAVLYMNLHGMLDYNKKYGYVEGDKLLREVAIILTDAFGEEACSRFEQGHFAAIAKTEGLEEKLDEIFKKLRNTNSKRSLPMSVGIYPDSMGMVETALACDRAKTASASTKNARRSMFIYFDEKMLRRELNSKYVIDNLDRAISENWITAYYQPLIRSTSRRVCDEEALARWIDPEKGIMSPADFIPVLEDTKLIYKVDLHIVDVILEHYKKKKHDKLNIVPVSVNLSRADFDMCDIVEEICNRVDTAGMPRELLTIEITESLIGENFAYIKEQVRRFQELGFKVWMDDFGSGYSSLNLLQDMQFDVIKFDMQFMRQFDNPKSRTMLAELLKMAVRLGIETVTEGVETEEQVEFLCEAGCTRMQGYFFSKPLPFEEILRRHREGLTIGFEDPGEGPYQSLLSAVNLYDLASKSNEEDGSTRVTLNAQPVVIAEVDSTTLKMVRSNKAYMKTAKIYSLLGAEGTTMRIDELSGKLNTAFYKAVLQCEKIGQKVFVNELIDNGDTIHAFVVRLADNEMNNASAYALAIVGITPRSDKGLTFAGVAKALSVDYIDIYQVDLDTEHFIEYTPDKENVDISVTREGEDFFAKSRQDALEFVHEDDQAAFIKAFTKENVVTSLDEHGVFSLTYRANFYGDSIYVSMKALRMSGEGNQIIIGVNSVDAQMRERATLQRLEEEKATFSRISVLMGDFIAIYSVDPETGAYMEYSSSDEYSEQGISKAGADFFADSRRNSKGLIHPDDFEELMKVLTMENILAAVQNGRVFTHTYRMKLGSDYTRLCLRAGLVKEKDGKQLIIGIAAA